MDIWPPTPRLGPLVFTVMFWKEMWLVVLICMFDPDEPSKDWFANLAVEPETITFPMAAVTSIRSRDSATISLALPELPSMRTAPPDGACTRTFEFVSDTP